MHPMRNHRMLMPVFLASILAFAGQPAHARDTRIDNEVSADLADARSEVRTELAAARRELDTGNLQLGDNLRFGTSDARASHADRALPRAEITPQGDFLIEGKPVAIDRYQRQELLLYRGEVIAIAKAGIDIGERSAQAALDAVDRGLFSLMFGAMTGSLERRIEKTVRETVEPGVRQNLPEPAGAAGPPATPVRHASRIPSLRHAGGGRCRGLRERDAPRVREPIARVRRQSRPRPTL